MATGYNAISSFKDGERCKHIKRILLPRPDERDFSFSFVTDLPGRSIKREAISQINELVGLAQNCDIPIPIRVINRPMTYTFTIFDATPTLDDAGNVLSWSRNAWVVVHVIEPSSHYNTKQHNYAIRNRGDDNQERFRRFVSAYEHIWETSEPFPIEIAPKTTKIE